MVKRKNLHNWFKQAKDFETKYSLIKVETFPTLGMYSPTMWSPGLESASPKPLNGTYNGKTQKLA